MSKTPPHEEAGTIPGPMGRNMLDSIPRRDATDYGTVDRSGQGWESVRGLFGAAVRTGSPIRRGDWNRSSAWTEDAAVRLPSCRFSTAT